MIGTRDMIRMGAWFAVCCELDLAEIVTVDDCDAALELWDDEMCTGVWASQAEALADLRRMDALEQGHAPQPRNG